MKEKPADCASDEEWLGRLKGQTVNLKIKITAKMATWQDNQFIVAHPGMPDIKPYSVFRLNSALGDSFSDKFTFTINLDHTDKKYREMFECIQLDCIKLFN